MTRPDRYGARARRLVPACVLLFCALSSSADAASVCLRPAAGQTVPAELVAALRVEALKARAPWRWRAASALDPACVTTGFIVTVHGSARVVVRRPGHPPTALDLSGVAPRSWARAAARSVIRTLDRPAALPLLAPGGPLVVPRRPSSSAIRLHVGAGAGWVGEGTSEAQFGVIGASVAVDPGAGWPVLALRGRYGESGEEVFSDSADPFGGIESAVALGEVLVVARSTLLDRWLHVGVGAGLGWQARQVGVFAPTRGATRVEEISHAGTVAGELKIGLAPTRRWFVGLTCTPRAYLGGRSHRVFDRTVYAAPRWGLGLEFGLEVIL